MTPWLVNTEDYPFEIRITPPTPCPSPTTLPYKHAFTRFNANTPPHCTLIDAQNQKDAQQGQQRRCLLATQFGEARVVRNDGRAWWREANDIQSPAHAASFAAALSDLSPFKCMTDDSRTGRTPLDTNIGNHCSSHPAVICSSSPNIIVQRVNSDCPGVGSVSDEMIWWNEDSDRASVRPSHAEGKEGNDEYMTRRDYQGCGQARSARRDLCRYEIQVEES